MNGNPYGAVPAALSETRLTLRDIMADLLANKVAEGRLRLEQSRAETETAMVGAGVEKDRLSNLREMAQMRMTREMHDEAAARAAGQFEKTFGIQEKELAIREQEGQDRTRLAEEQINLGKENVKLAQARTKLEAAAGAREAEQFRRETEKKTLREWADIALIPQGQRRFFGISAENENKLMTRKDAEVLKANADIIRKASPSLNFISYGNELTADIQTIQNQLDTPGLTPEKTAELQKQLGRLSTEFKSVKAITMDSKPDLVKAILEATQKNWWGDNHDALVAEFKTLDKYEEHMSQNAEKIRGVYWDDANALRNPKPPPPAEQVAAGREIHDLYTKEIKSGNYAFSPMQRMIIDKMLTSVEDTKAPTVLRSLKNILNATPKKAQATAFAGGEPWKTVQ